MSVPVFVPDASVLLKWVLKSKEEHSESALAVRESFLSGRCRLIVPSLWIYEVGNVLGLKQPGLAGELLGELVSLCLEEESPAAIHRWIFELMMTLRVTFYDASYHATAFAHDGTLITADLHYFRKAAAKGRIMRVHDWGKLSP
jgi:predicted nucleic acid-binding protein